MTQETSTCAGCNHTGPYSEFAIVIEEPICHVCFPDTALDTWKERKQFFALWTEAKTLTGHTPRPQWAKAPDGDPDRAYTTEAPNGGRFVLVEDDHGWVCMTADDAYVCWFNNPQQAGVSAALITETEG